MVRCTSCFNVVHDPCLNFLNRVFASGENQEEPGLPLASGRQTNAVLHHYWPGGNIQLGNVLPEQVRNKFSCIYGYF